MAGCRSSEQQALNVKQNTLTELSMDEVDQVAGGFLFWFLPTVRVNYGYGYGGGYGHGYGGYYGPRGYYGYR